jgi:U3 small nucleolar RNA-associated protein 19
MLRLQEYTVYYDLVYYIWKIMPSLTPRCGGAILYTNNNIFIKNFLNLINSSIIVALNSSSNSNNNSNSNSNGHHHNSNGKNGYHNHHEDRRDSDDGQQKYIVYDDQHPGRTSFKYDYAIVRRSMNKIWNCVMLWNYNNDEVIQRQILIILLEKVLPHLDKPLLMTDFLMESLDIGGPISLLALQGIFLLIQHHNLTYPDIYEKLYSMFEPEIFHTKFKARLFYLADVFLTSSHLPENLVAAFVKRLSRLSLVAPPQDIVIILYFIGNLILRHPGLKCLIFNNGMNGGSHLAVVPRDPYIMDERKPTESKALESSLWEIATLQYHALPSISAAAKFISNPLPTHEWDLSSVLELNEDDIFDQEIKRTFNNHKYPLNYEKVTSMFLPKDDKIKQYWKLF